MRIGVSNLISYKTYIITKLFRYDAYISKTWSKSVYHILQTILEFVVSCLHMKKIHNLEYATTYTRTNLIFDTNS